MSVVPTGCTPRYTQATPLPEHLCELRSVYQVRFPQGWRGGRSPELGSDFDCGNEAAAWAPEKDRELAYPLVLCCVRLGRDKKGKGPRSQVVSRALYVRFLS